MTISAGLRGNPNPVSQANGAMMRISPLGIFGAGFELNQVAEWAMQYAALTHPNLICQQANALFAMGIAHAIKSGCDRKELYQRIRQWAVDMPVESALLETIEKAADAPPADYVHQQGWVLIAFQNALYQLLHAPSLEDGVVDTIMRGGDTDTNAAICGALLGAVSGREAIPAQWLDSLQNCRPEAGHPRVRHQRPECFWPVDVLDLAKFIRLHRGMQKQGVFKSETTQAVHFLRIWQHIRLCANQFAPTGNPATVSDAAMGGQNQDRDSSLCEQR
jgi:hypothetical protein